MINECATCHKAGGKLSNVDVCPFHSDADGHCRAAFSGQPIDRHFRNLRCTTEDYDGCPLFLARALRSSRPQSRREPWPLHQK